MNFWQWVIAYWQRRRVLIALPEFQYLITFYRGKIEMVKTENYEPKGHQLYQVWYDEEIQ